MVWIAWLLCETREVYHDSSSQKSSLDDWEVWAIHLD